jgi:hypothetical protein
MDHSAGFANWGFAMIHGDYYRMNAQANEHRRPVLLQAWYAEFADVVFNEVILNPMYGPRNAAIHRDIDYLGAHDILNDNVDCLRNSSSYFVLIQSAISRNITSEAKNLGPFG